MGPRLLAERAEEVEEVGAIRGELGRAAGGGGGVGAATELAERRRVLDAELGVGLLVLARLLELGRGLGVIAGGRGAPARGAVQLAERDLEVDHRRIPPERARERRDRRGILADLALREPQPAQEPRVGVLLRLHGPEQRFRLLRRALGALVAGGDHRPERGVVGLAGRRGLERRDGLVVAMKPDEHLPEAPLCAGALRIEGEPGVLRVDRVRVAPGVDERLGEPVVRLGVVGPRAQALLEGEDGVVGLAPRAPHPRELAVRVGGIRRRARRLLEVFGRRLELAALRQEDA